MNHEMKLNNGPFERIKNGTKTIELRLNDENRQLLKIKDLIEFTNRTNNEKKLVLNSRNKYNIFIRYNFINLPI